MVEAGGPGGLSNPDSSVRKDPKEQTPAHVNGEGTRRQGRDLRADKTFLVHQGYSRG